MQKDQFLQVTSALAETIYDGLTFEAGYGDSSPSTPAPRDATDARAQTQPAPAPSIPIDSSDLPSFSGAAVQAAITLDLQGDNDPFCGVPAWYDWAKICTYEADVHRKTQGMSAISFYNQVYNKQPRQLVPNCRVQITEMVAYVLPIASSQWMLVPGSRQVTTGAAFAEDFYQNYSTGEDRRVDSPQLYSVRSGIGNAAGDAGKGLGRYLSDGSEIGCNNHGFGSRLELNWAGADALVCFQAMRLIPHEGTDMSDCEKLGYVANLGIDGWRDMGSGEDFNGGHTGVSGSRFKTVTPEWQLFANYVGPIDKANSLPFIIF